jgi:SAM-dependent methyltransferase
MEVEQVYNNIAKEFSNSRYRVWSGVKKFLDLLPINTTNGDIGCGNGKNMMYRTDIQFIGYDISDELIKICLERNLNVHKGNILNLPITDNYFDNTISIAVIHHLEKQEDRIKALSELLRITKPGGKILVYVWSFLQDKLLTNGNAIAVINFGGRFNSTTFGTGASINTEAVGNWSSTNYGTKTKPPRTSIARHE